MILAPVAFGLAIRNALSLDRHYAAVHDRLRELEAAEAAAVGNPGQTTFPARLTPGKSIPPRGPGQVQDLPEVPQWIRDWMDIMDGRPPARLPGHRDESDGGELRAAVVYEFPVCPDADDRVRDTGS